ncbi:hypothetical protein JCM5353_007497 [Sporobolomyces roseus]
MASHHRATATASTSTWGASPSYPAASTRDILVGYIERACDPSLHEPNLSLDLEIADLINSKKANTPREAAVETVRLVNHRNSHVAMLALHLLDILVKNCGYPFHLQISTKEFLNELVRRFPERPPTFPPPPMAKVLELVHEWKNTICLTSKHKEDLVHIRDMHRLLSYKGYRFPDFDRRQASVLNPTENLQTPDELEEEDRAAQAAKLQELIRRGTPKDLAAAQELMKVMAGAEPDKKPNYEQQVSKELDRIQQRVLLLNEMLNNAKPKEKFVEGDAYDQIAQKCRHVQPKIQKWIGESAENNPDAMDRLLLINDLINNVTKRYESFKGGDRSATADIDPALAGGPSSKAKAQAQQVSLIDFDDDAAFAAPSSTNTSTPTTSKATMSNPMDDLAGLGSLSLGPSSNPFPPSSTSAASAQAGSLFDLNDAFTSPAPAATNGNGTSGSRPPQPPPTNSSGSFFTNPAYSNSSSASIPWNSRPSSTQPPLMGGGSGASTPNYSSRNSTASRNSMNNAGAPQPPPKKDAFADLLGDF